MKIFKNADMVCDNERVYYGAKYEKKSLVVSIQAYAHNYAYTVELSNEEVAKMISLVDWDTIRPIVNKMKENELKELRDDITDDFKYIMEKAVNCKDRDKLRSILEALEVITAEI